MQCKKICTDQVSTELCQLSSSIRLFVNLFQISTALGECCRLQHKITYSHRHTPAEDTLTNRLTHPVVVHSGDSALEVLADLHINVLVETGSHRTEGGQWGPIILTSFERQRFT